MPGRALVFPGQGAHDPWMAGEALKRKDHLLEYLESLLGPDVLKRTAEDKEIRGRNEVASLLTAWWSLHLLKKNNPGNPQAVGGYSVGQFTACHAAGIWTEKVCLNIIHRRALLMNHVVTNLPPMGMSAVIGLPVELLQNWLKGHSRTMDQLEITNLNAPGQVTLGGPLSELEIFEEDVKELKPRKVLRLETSGAWHHSALKKVVKPLEELLEEFPMGAATCPVLSNLNGEWLPTEPVAFRKAMAQQVCAPVQWEKGIRHVMASGADELLEVGYGSVLTRFGFFIDRSVKHTPLLKEIRNP